MRRSLRFAALFFLGFPLAGCSDIGSTGPRVIDPPQAGPMRPLTSAEKAVVGADNAFGFRLFVSLNQAAPGENLFICPLSAGMALGMALNGAAGSTREAMQTTMGFTGMSQEEINRSCQGLASALTGLDPLVRMQIANSIWYRPGLAVEDTFKNLNKVYFNAEVNAVDFTSSTAPRTINGWAEENTNGRITNVVPDPIPPDVVMYLINAVYFKGSWTYRFDSTITRDDYFTASGGSRVPCKMMAQSDTVPYFSLNGVQGIDLPYGSAGFSMTVILPPSGADIDGFVAGLTQDGWNSWTAQLKKQPVILQMPRFRIAWRQDLKDVLSVLGMEIAFSDGADFSGIDRRDHLRFSGVLHSTFVQVDEEGTEAAGVTVIGVFGTVIGHKDTTPLMRLDRPFIFAIRERQSGTILFIGKLAIPS